MLYPMYQMLRKASQPGEQLMPFVWVTNVDSCFFVCVFAPDFAVCVFLTCLQHVWLYECVSRLIC